MSVSYTELLSFVQHLAPTWRKTQHVNFSLLIAGLLERPRLCLSEIARAYPSPTQPLHGRLKRLTRFLDNPRLDEAALSIRWLKLCYRFGNDPPNQDYPSKTARPILPILLDTTYFEPFAVLIASVPCGSRALPVALTTYHRSDLTACFPPQAAWPRPDDDPLPPRPRRGHRAPLASSTPIAFLSQNQIEEHLIDYVFTLLSGALRGVLVADRGFARASLFRYQQEQGRDFVIRIDAQTCISLSPLGSHRRVQGEVAKVTRLEPGQREWFPDVFYGKEDQIRINLLGVWDKGQKEPWYLASTLEDPNKVEVLYRWRMRLECANRDEKTGVLLRESGDKHAIKNPLHLHRLMLALATAEWLCALTGLEAWRDLPMLEKRGHLRTIVGGSSAKVDLEANSTLERSVVGSGGPEAVGQGDDCGEAEGKGADYPADGNGGRSDQLCDRDEDGPSLPPAVVPHRGEVPKVPTWMSRFAARGHLSYVRLGLEVLRSAQFGFILRQMVRWLASYLSSCAPLWRPYQIRYRLKHWWLGPG